MNSAPPCERTSKWHLSIVMLWGKFLIIALNYNIEVFGSRKKLFDNTRVLMVGTCVLQQGGLLGDWDMKH